MSVKKILLVIILLLTSKLAWSQPQCEVESPESTRIYFANGMSNNEDAAISSAEEIKLLLNSTPSNSYDYSYNANENWITQLIEVYRQKKKDQQQEVRPEEYWYWLSNMDESPQWFQTVYQESMEQFQESSVYNDPDLIKHFNNYLNDIYNGKRVVIVAHSQGNFYANNAYLRILNEYPQYQQYIGIVGIASPSNTVWGWNNYNRISPYDLYYTTNESDLIINLVRAFYPSTLPPNPENQSGGYSNGFFNTNHGFVGTYLDPNGPFRNRISDHILQTISSIAIPEKHPECQQVSVQTNPATNITSSTVQLRGTILTGHDIDAKFIIKPSYESSTLSCFPFGSPTYYNYKAGDTFDSQVSVQPNTTYYYRFCGRDENDILSSGAILSFTTPQEPQTSCGILSFHLRTWGDGVGTHTMSNNSGYVLVEFEPYYDVDKMEIWQGGNKILQTPGYVGSCNYGIINYDPNNGTTLTMKVDELESPSDGWALYIHEPCPSPPTLDDHWLCF